MSHDNSPATAQEPVSRKNWPLVLVVEDANLVRHVIAEVLRLRGADSLLAHNGQDALEKAEKHTVDLVIMDVEMSVMDGLEATRRIRALGGWRASVPIVGFSNRADESACRAAGMSALVMKGDGIEALLEIIGQLVPVRSPDDPAHHE